MKIPTPQAIYWSSRMNALSSSMVAHKKQALKLEGLNPEFIEPEPSTALNLKSP